MSDRQLLALMAAIIHSTGVVDYPESVTEARRILQEVNSEWVD